jgi:Uncharacterized conserved protein
MHSALAITREMYDMEAAASDLARQVRERLPEIRRGCGIVFADPGYDLAGLLQRLEQTLGVEVVGATSAAMLSSEGYHTMCATLLVMSGDDCVFGTALSPALRGEAGERPLEEALRETYERALAKLGGTEPAMVFTLSAANAGCAEDVRLTLLRKLAGGRPVFGGVAADHFEYVHARAGGEGHSGDSSMALLLIGGNVRPRFVLRNVPRKHLSRSRVTSSAGNVVHTIDGMSAHDYMLRHGADASSAMALHFTPLLVEAGSDRDGEEQIICRPFVALDPQTGFGTTISEIPEGSAVTVQAVEAADILDATRDGMETLMRDMEEERDYTYSTVLVMSCAARHMVLAIDKMREAELGRDVFPASLVFSGFYSFGEYCPISVNEGGADNRLHNLSIGFCAL